MLLQSVKVIIITLITFAMCNIDSKNETEEGYLVLPGTTPKMMVYWTMLSLFLFSFVFPLVVLFLNSVFSVRALWSLSLFFSVPVPVLFASLSTRFFFPLVCFTHVQYNFLPYPNDLLFVSLPPEKGQGFSL
ncbi:hypothetical protein NC653_004531 [Populus alba x Populus x berolinensis]|uniref:Uncharacterized protein n=1 Tax=Populus alba x Populus x berolinensis TaxID=444605 RepID=A0AAD6RWX9_9ROSI|nr:hypothetical protein NC653_004531 [Populus alba x Populus x berolinensis]